MDRVRILHYIPSKKTVRCHSNFKDNEFFENYYFFFETCLLKNSTQKNSSRFKNTKMSPIGLIQYVKKVKPDILIVSNKLVGDKFIQFLRNNIKLIYFIHHGIWNPFQIKSFVKSDIYKKKFDIFDKAFVCYRNWIAFSKYSNKFYPLNGLPQIDLMLDTDFQSYKNIIHKSRVVKTILFVANCKEKSDEELHEIMHYLNIFCYNYKYHLYLKLKRNLVSQEKFLRNIRKRSYLTIVPIEESMYHYFFCDIVLIQTCGTSLVESLLLDKPTILVQIKDQTDYMDCKKYSHIPQVTNLGVLGQTLLGIHKINKTVDYIEQKNQFLKEYLGERGNATNQILNVIKKDLYKYKNI